MNLLSGKIFCSNMFLEVFLGRNQDDLVLQNRHICAVTNIHAHTREQKYNLKSTRVTKVSTLEYWTSLYSLQLAMSFQGDVILQRREIYREVMPKKFLQVT